MKRAKVLSKRLFQKQRDLRRLEIEALGQEAAASRLLSERRVIGFNTYGEQHHGRHINQTFTGVALGAAGD